MEALFVLLPFIAAALGLGFMGSFHCVGMCGPLALSLPVQHLNGGRKLAGILLYNFGRAITYAVIGLVLGWVGMQFSLFGWQQTLSLLLGSLLLVVFTAGLFGKRLLRHSYVHQFWSRYITTLLGGLLGRRSLSALLGMGLLNGLLPCGLVYISLAAAVATGHAVKSAAFMFLFGLGTMPAMMVVCYAGNMISLAWRNKIRSVVPYVVGIMGMLLVLRGLNLNIPYISPALQEEQVNCCHK